MSEPVVITRAAFAHNLCLALAGENPASQVTSLVRALQSVRGSNEVWMSRVISYFFTSPWEKSDAERVGLLLGRSEVELLRWLDDLADRPVINEQGPLLENSQALLELLVDRFLLLTPDQRSIDGFVSQFILVTWSPIITARLEPTLHKDKMHALSHAIAEVATRRCLLPHLSGAWRSIAGWLHLWNGVDPAVQEQLAAFQAGWMNDFRARYPRWVNPE